MILFRLLKAERIKLKRSPIWLAFLLMPVIPAILGTLNYLQNLELLKNGWYSLWTQHTLFTCYFFLPVMVGIYCAYLMRLEHSRKNWNQLLTMPFRRSLIFFAKLITVSLMILLSELWIGVLFILSGRAAGLTAVVPYRSMVLWCCGGTLGGMVMAAIQLLLSLYIKSFALPVGISFAGGISGLLFLAKGFGHVWPYALMAYGMNSNSPHQLPENGYAGFAVVCIGYILIISCASGVILSRRDI